MPELSLYNQLNNHFGKQLNPQLQRKASLIAFSHALEDEVIKNQLAPVMFTAFQKAAYFDVEAERYQQLKKLARGVAVYGEGLSSAATYPNDWFVVVNEPRFKALLACRELEPERAINEPYRPFLSLWSYDREVVDYACQVLADHDRAMQPAVAQILVEPHRPLEQAIFVRNVGDRILAEMERTNLRAIHQIGQNQRLLEDLERQNSQLAEIAEAKATVEGERQMLETELQHLYHELTRSQQVATDAVIARARLEQSHSVNAALIQQLQNELALLSQECDEPRIAHLQQLLDQLKN